MANYCTAGDIKVLLHMKNDFDDSTPTEPSLTEVNTEIDNITKEIDSHLRAIGLTAQPTDTNILGMLKKYAGYGSACRVGMTYLRNKENVGSTQSEFYCQKYSDFLEKILKHPEIITDSQAGNALFLENQVTDGTISESNLNSLYLNKDFEV